MSVEETIARSLPHQSWLRSVGGDASYHSADIPFALAAIKDHGARELLYAKATGVIDWKYLELVWEPVVIKLAMVHRWQLRKEHRGADILILTRICLSECLLPRACPGCRGIKKVWSDTALRDVDCPRCGALGTVPYSQRQNARVFGCSHTEWARTWHVRYRQVMQVMEDAVAVAERQFCKALFGRSGEA